MHRRLVMPIPVLGRAAAFPIGFWVFSDILSPSAGPSLVHAEKESYDLRSAFTQLRLLPSMEYVRQDVHRDESGEVNVGEGSQ
jgi:hypothetical protein